MVCMLPGMELLGRQSQEPRNQTRFSNQVSGLSSRSSSFPWVSSSSSSQHSRFKQRVSQVFRILVLLCSLLAECFTEVAEVLARSARRLGSACAFLWNGGDSDWSSLWRTSGEDDFEGDTEASLGFEGGGGGTGGGSGRRKGREKKRLDSRSALPPRRLRILLCGPVHAGKTALLYRLKIGSFIPTVPSMGAYKEDFTVELEIHRRPTASRKQAYAPPPGISLPASTACPESSSPSPWNEEVGGGRVLSGDSCKDALLEEGYMSAGADTTDVGWKRLPRGQVEEEKKMVPKSRKEQAASSSCALEKVSCDVFQEKVHLTIWDLAGGDGLETRWRAMQEECDAVMYVLDSTLFTSPEKSLSKQRAVEDARREILGLFYEEYFVLHKEIRFLMYLTKQDLRAAAAPSQVLELLELPDDLRARLLVMPCSAVSGDGLFEGLQCLASDVECDCFGGRAGCEQKHEDREVLSQKPADFVTSTRRSGLPSSSSTKRVERDHPSKSLEVLSEEGSKHNPPSVDVGTPKPDGAQKRSALVNEGSCGVQSGLERKGSSGSPSSRKLSENTTETGNCINTSTDRTLVDLLNDRDASEGRDSGTDTFAGPACHA